MNDEALDPTKKFAFTLVAAEMDGHKPKRISVSEAQWGSLVLLYKKETGRTDLVDLRLFGIPVTVDPRQLTHVCLFSE